MPKPSPASPAFLESARAFYGEAFDHKRKRDLSLSIAEWAEMEQDEQSFAVAHLLYLNLQAQAGGQRLLTQVRDLLDEVAEGLTTAIEASLSEEAVEVEEVLEEGSLPQGDRVGPEDEEGSVQHEDPSDTGTFNGGVE